MKKQFILILSAIILMVTFSSCSNNYSDYAKNPSNGAVYEKPLRLNLSFEEMIDSADNIVVATFEGVEHYDTDSSDYKFKIVSQMKGTIEENALYVCVPNYTVSGTSISFAEGTDTTNCVIGKPYILILEHRISVYYEHDEYMSWTQSFIPADDVDDLYISDHEKLIDHSSMTQSDVQTPQAFINYIANQIAKNPGTPGKHFGTEYIRSDKIEDIVALSSNIVRIVPKALEKSLTDTEIYSCEVIRTYKGEFLPSATINIKFFTNTVIPDTEYIVALAPVIGDDKYEVTDTYVLSAKNSLMDTTKEDEILDLLGGSADLTADTNPAE